MYDIIFLTVELTPPLAGCSAFGALCNMVCHLRPSVACHTLHHREEQKPHPPQDIKVNELVTFNYKNVI